MKKLCLLLGATCVVLFIGCARWMKAAHQLVLENHRLELIIEQDSLIISNAPAEQIREAKLALIDFDRQHYGQFYKSRNK